MAQTHTTLPSLFTAIANAIRSKTGTTSAIVADKFPDYITTVYNAAKVGTASAADVKTGKTFTNSSSVGVDGAMPNASTGTASTGSAVSTITPSTSVQYVNVTAGYTAARYWKINAMTAGSAAVTGTTWTANPTITVSTKGVVTSTYNTTKSVGASVTAGYINAATAGTMQASGTTTYQISTFAATTYTPSTAVQTASVKDKYCTGNIRINAIPSSFKQLKIISATCSTNTQNFSQVDTGTTASWLYNSVAYSSVGFTPDFMVWTCSNQILFSGCWIKDKSNVTAAFVRSNHAIALNTSTGGNWGTMTSGTFKIPWAESGQGSGGTFWVVFGKYS